VFVPNQRLPEGNLAHVAVHVRNWLEPRSGMLYQGINFPAIVRQSGTLEPRCRPLHDRPRREGHLGWQLGHPPIHDGDDRFPRTPTITSLDTL
jgi:hypothetical protein